MKCWALFIFLRHVEAAKLRINLEWRRHGDILSYTASDGAVYSGNFIVELFITAGYFFAALCDVCHFPPFFERSRV
jgi:hypothetical protein